MDSPSESEYEGGYLRKCEKKTIRYRIKETTGTIPYLLKGEGGEHSRMRCIGPRPWLPLRLLRDM